MTSGWGRAVSLVAAAALSAGCATPATPQAVDSGTPTVSSGAERTAEPSTGATRDAEARPRLVDDARWVERDGVRALEVTPARVLRDETDPAVVEEAWRRVLRAVPDADSPGMKAQFVCHAVFAPEKRGWFLEPARPDVGQWATVRAGCNPGEVMDVG